MSEARFGRLIAEALDALPAEIRAWLDNVEVVSADWPTAAQLDGGGASRSESLFGLYEGVPLTDRSSHYGMVPPDKISIFRGPILAACATDAAVREELRRTVIHELAHHFGIDDDRLELLGAD